MFCTSAVFFVTINGESQDLWRAVDHEGEILESYVTRFPGRKAALKSLRKSMKRCVNGKSSRPENFDPTALR